MPTTRLSRGSATHIIAAAAPRVPKPPPESTWTASEKPSEKRSYRNRPPARKILFHLNVNRSLPNSIPQRPVRSGPVPTTSWRPTTQFVHLETNRTLNSRSARPSFSRSVLSTHCSCFVLVCRNVIYSYIRPMIIAVKFLLPCQLTHR